MRAREVRILTEALREIANPIAYWQAHLDPGEDLNMSTALHMAEQSATYQRIAERALARYDASRAERGNDG